jgi:VWFA-related protein
MRARNDAVRRRLAVLAAACLLTAPLRAQNPQPPAVNPRQAPAAPPTPLPLGKATIRSTVDLVEIDVQVTDKNGKPIKGLNQDQFTLTEDGKSQKVSSFEYNDIEKIETAPATDETPVTIPLGTVTSPGTIKTQVRDHRLIVLFFDMTSLESEDLLRSTRAADKFLRDQMTPADLVAVVAFGNTLKVVANLTNDRKLLQDAVAALVPGHEAALATLAEAATPDGEISSSEDTGAAFTADDTEFNVFNTDRKLAAVEAVANILGGIPGKKAMIEFTGGVAQTGEENRSQLTAWIPAG